MRILLYTGKGGVGKTTVSAASAVRCSRLGYKTIVISTDAAHSLSDSFECEVGCQPTSIAEKLDAQEIDIYYELERNYGLVRSFLAGALKRQGFSRIMAEELVLFPGLEELFNLLVLQEIHALKEYDVVVVDCAPTASTARLLRFPESIQWYIERLFHYDQTRARSLRPFVDTLGTLAQPEREIIDAMEVLQQRVKAVQEILVDPATTSVRIVCIPEKMVLRESQRSFTYLHLFGFPLDAVVVNRILPEGAGDTYFSAWRSMQQRYLEEAKMAFHHLPVFEGRLYPREVAGVEALAQVAEDLFGGADLSRPLVSEPALEVGTSGESDALRIRLPFVKREGIDLWTKGDELILKVGNMRRNVFLPRALVSRDVTGAHFEGEVLTITFGGKADD